MTAHPSVVRKTHVRRTELNTAYLAEERVSLFRYLMILLMTY